MSTRDELAELLDRIFYDHEGGYIPNEENVEYAQADALIAEGWRKMPSRDELANVLGLQAALDWVDGETVGQFGLRLADAVLALMDRGQ